MVEAIISYKRADKSSGYFLARGAGVTYDIKKAHRYDLDTAKQLAAYESSNSSTKYTVLVKKRKKHGKGDNS
jgi:NADH:ubiquinone oxidoreductase subunit D